MQTLKNKINSREIYITMRSIFKNVLPRDMIDYIHSYIKGDYKMIYENFDRSIKEISHDMNYKFTKGGYDIINCMIYAFVIKIVNMAININYHCKKYTITSREIQTSMRLCSHNDTKLLKLIISNATKSITMYNAEYAGNNIKTRRNTKIDSNLKLYPTRIESIMRQYIKQYNNDNSEHVHLGIGAIIYLTGVLDIIVQKLIISSSQHKTSKNLISFDSVIKGCNDDQSLKLLFYELFI